MFMTIRLESVKRNLLVIARVNSWKTSELNGVAIRHDGVPYDPDHIFGHGLISLITPAERTRLGCVGD